jgi:hypothetical protein
MEVKNQKQDHSAYDVPKIDYDILRKLDVTVLIKNLGGHTVTEEVKKKQNVLEDPKKLQRMLALRKEELVVYDNIRKEYLMKVFYFLSLQFFLAKGWI